MAAEESARQILETLNEEQAGRILAGMNEVIRAGEEMRKLRAEMIKALAGFGWTQERIAQFTDMSQPAVSKQMAKHRTDDLPPHSTGALLGQRDVPWLEGRLWGLAELISEALDETARCTRCVNALTRGKKRFTPRNIDELRRLVEEDLRLHLTELPDGCQAAYDEISRGLDLPSKVAPTTSASVRRSIGHRIQRDLLRGAHAAGLRGGQR
ncbi:sigma-70 family RNA polymerase sigma factor [Streptomyces sp. JH34]|uniref:sigma-70 family RNA polymerase sigma factor n=1 Tax=Streptomyces sp. JH34 TaxID=2793633 RepID=UPI0023F80AFA|nr:sigma-70 family RNA polymerase sigma factor [Streptomyces sp. JH34]MDF6023050.1 sigma-70 family RNA polymerase sigma factor [Streptomyces sp. JH34]